MKQISPIVIFSFIIVFLLAIFSFTNQHFTPKTVVNSVSKSQQNAMAKEVQEDEIFNPTTEIIFAGDLMFDRYIRQIANKKGNDFVFEKVTQVFSAGNLVVLNLEGPITDNRSVSLGTNVGQKGHMVFTFDKSLAGTLKAHNVALVNLGNNHILNFGESGLNQTLQYLNQVGVKYFGQIKNHPDLISTQIEMNGIKLSFVSFNNFSGANADETINEIKRLEKISDFVIVYTHWGSEYATLAGSWQKINAHQFVDAGADLVIGSHPHVVQNIEIYQGKKIYYSLGNFVFDQYFSANTMQGLCVKAVFNKQDETITTTDIKIKMDKNGQTSILE